MSAFLEASGNLVRAYHLFIAPSLPPSFLPEHPLWTLREQS